MSEKTKTSLIPCRVRFPGKGVTITAETGLTTAADGHYDPDKMTAMVPVGANHVALVHVSQAIIVLKREA